MGRFMCHRGGLWTLPLEHSAICQELGNCLFTPGLYKLSMTLYYES